MSRRRHPDAEALASFRAGPASGFRARRLARHVAGCARCASVSEQLGEVSSLLAAVPAPSLPELFERRITAALAAEATARAGAASPAGVGPLAAAADAGADGAGQEPAARVRAGRPSRQAAHRPRQRSQRFRLAIAVSPVLACLLAGFGYLASQTGPSSSSSAESASAPQAPVVPSASAPSPGSNAIGPASGHGPFLVTASGTNYRQATLRQQVGDELTAYAYSSSVKTAAPNAIPAPSGPAVTHGTPVPSPDQTAGGSGFAGAEPTPAAESTSGSAPSPALVGCVLHLTGGVTPSFVDRATYQGRPAYVIAVPSRAWVVGLGCTASKPELITSVSLGP